MKGEKKTKAIRFELDIEIAERYERLLSLRNKLHGGYEETKPMIYSQALIKGLPDVEKEISELAEKVKEQLVS